MVDSTAFRRDRADPFVFLAFCRHCYVFFPITFFWGAIGSLVCRHPAARRNAWILFAIAIVQMMAVIYLAFWDSIVLRDPRLVRRRECLATRARDDHLKAARQFAVQPTVPTRSERLPMRRSATRPMAVALCLLAAGCSSDSVDQGKFERLKVGMSSQDVEAILGKERQGNQRR